LSVSYETTECPDGYYSFEGEDTCTKCSDGQGPGVACPVKDGSFFIDCSSLLGVYLGTDQSKCQICNAGNYCPIGSAVELSCSAGEYSSPGASHCTKCPPGFQCPSTSGVLIEPCPLGSFSPGGLATCELCPPNHSCNRTEAVPCPSNMFSDYGSGYCRFFNASEYEAEVFLNDITIKTCEPG